MSLGSSAIFLYIGEMTKSKTDFNFQIAATLRTGSSMLSLAAGKAQRFAAVGTGMIHMCTDFTESSKLEFHFAPEFLKIGVFFASCRYVFGKYTV